MSGNVLGAFQLGLFHRDLVVLALVPLGLWRLGCLLRLQRRQHLPQLFQFTSQVVARSHFTDGQPEGSQLSSQVFGVGLRLLRATPVLVERHPVAVLLAVLRQQDQRRGV